MPNIVTRNKFHFAPTGGDTVYKLYQTGIPQYLKNFTLRNTGNSQVLLLIQEAAPIAGDFTASTCVYPIDAGEFITEDGVIDQTDTISVYDLNTWWVLVLNNGHLIFNWTEMSS